MQTFKYACVDFKVSGSMTGVCGKRRRQQFFLARDGDEMEGGLLADTEEQCKHTESSLVL